MSSVVDKGGSSYKMLKGSMVGFIKGFRIRSFMSMLHKHSLVIIPFFNLWISLHFSTFTSWKSSQFHLSLPCSKTIHEHAPSLVEKGGSSYKKLIGSMVEFMEGNMYQQEYYFVRERRNFSDVPSLCYCVHCSKKKNCECLWQTSFLVLLFPTLHRSICIMVFLFERQCFYDPCHWMDSIYCKCDDLMNVVTDVYGWIDALEYWFVPMSGI